MDLKLKNLEIHSPKVKEFILNYFFYFLKILLNLKFIKLKIKKISLFLSVIFFLNLLFCSKSKGNLVIASDEVRNLYG
jgi:hypothetical protein